ncbi:MAG: flavodoxin [Chloroflexota bacterium]
MKKIGLFFGSNTGNTEMNADLFKKKFDEFFAEKVTIEVHNIGTTDIKKMEEYTYLIVGSPTWNIGELQDDWAIKFDSIKSLNLQNKLIAMFGVGDQFGYPDNYCDAIGILGKAFEGQGAELVGVTDAAEYEFSNSLGVENGAFIGLALDDDNQNSLTDERVEYWVDQLMYDFGIIPSPIGPAGHPDYTPA